MCIKGYHNKKNKVMRSVVDVNTELLRLHVLALDNQGSDDHTSIEVASVATDYYPEVKEVPQTKVVVIIKVT